MDKRLAREVLDYLEAKRMAFCWLEDGTLISRKDCEVILGLKAACCTLSHV